MTKSFDELKKTIGTPLRAQSAELKERLPTTAEVNALVELRSRSEDAVVVAYLNRLLADQ